MSLPLPQKFDSLCEPGKSFDFSLSTQDGALLYFKYSESISRQHEKDLIVDIKKFLKENVRTLIP